jgi:hypothetical protein
MIELIATKNRYDTQRKLRLKEPPSEGSVVELSFKAQSLITVGKEVGHFIKVHSLVIGVEDYSDGFGIEAHPYGPSNGAMTSITESYTFGATGLLLPERALCKDNGILISVTSGYLLPSNLQPQK